MRRTALVLVLAGSAAIVAACSGMGPFSSSGNKMSFFVTSANPGKGADFGGLAGADRYCQTLASAAGAGGKTWRAYLSTTGAGGVNARDRIGRGPWMNAKGEVIAGSVDELHATNRITKQTALTERGDMVMGRGDAVNMHDVLTGSSPDGRAMAAAGDSTCGNWTKSGEGSAIVGHHDRTGLNEEPPAKSWNSSHPSRGCSLESLKATGGDGRLYCFAAN
ncbi:hypothetical protein [Ramlibacter alkalitolerans]|uniref:Lectin n=1 Tax=Ramlibacter alkalitolerans TaxID=2039631 RepID=A0ABS1JPV9_9BURK|nr:hypothetical protein [Ramlibacter alkalitolerans]MBL0426309.1 hypothetical protein [Ramlibacter alkalitolerans]